jgi:hypothetical protein
MSTTPAKKKNSLFAKIENRSEAVKVIKDTSIAFMVLGVIQGAIGYFLFPELLYDAALYIVLGLILLVVKSRIAAVLLLILSGISVVTTVTNLLGITASGGGNIIVALIIFGAAVKAVEATFKLHGRFAHEPGDYNMDTSEYSTDTVTLPAESNRAEPRFTTLEWVLIGLAGLLVLVLLVVVFVVVLG